MPVQVVCASRSPLMLTGIEESQDGAQQRYFQAIEAVSQKVHDFRPDLVVVFGPDHFNSFFYDLMPSFCVGTAATGSADWGIKPEPLKVPHDLALECVRYLHSKDFDVAVSHEMKVDHGATIPLIQLTGALARYPVLPIFVNCIADPAPSFRRVRLLGEEVGKFFSDRDARITFLGSGGLSHDPPTPQLGYSSPSISRRLINRATPTKEELDAREARVIGVARDLVVNKGPCLPPDEDWDREFLDMITRFDVAALDALRDEEISKVAGVGAHEVRSWVAAVAAARQCGTIETQVDHYSLIPEWLTGMGIISATA